MIVVDYSNLQHVGEARVHCHYLNGLIKEKKQLFTLPQFQESHTHTLNNIELEQAHSNEVRILGHARLLQSYAPKVVYNQDKSWILTGDSSQNQPMPWLGVLQPCSSHNLVHMTFHFNCGRRLQYNGHWGDTPCILVD